MVRQILRGIALDLLGCSAQPSNGIHILNGHRISLGVPDGKVFAAQLKKLSPCVEFVNFEEAVRLIVTHTEVDKPIVAFSFDDGFEECYTHIAPILEDFGIRAAFFINPNFVTGDTGYIRNFTENVVKTPNKKPMSWNQILDLHRRGHLIGAHTLDHYCIDNNNVSEVERQIGMCKTEIERHLSAECLYFAFPFGRLSDVNALSIEIALKYYTYVFSQSDYKNYFSFDGKVINRRHFEPDWKISHVKYFLSHSRRWTKK